jgi:hypothetical protein
MLYSSNFVPPTVVVVKRTMSTSQPFCGPASVLDPHQRIHHQTARRDHALISDRWRPADGAVDLIPPHLISWGSSRMWIQGMSSRSAHLLAWALGGSSHIERWSVRFYGAVWGAVETRDFHRYLRWTRICSHGEAFADTPGRPP